MDQYFGNLSDEELLMMGQEAGYLPKPSQTDQPAPMSQGLTPPDVNLQSPPASPAPQGPTSIGMSQSQRGFSGDAYNRIEQTKPGLNRDMAMADAQAAQGAERDRSILDSTRGPSIEAEKMKADAEVGKIRAQGEQALVMQRLQDGFAVEEAKINAEATAASNQAKADYLAALADFRAAKVDPGQLWGKMSGFDRFGMLATAFVHDFLGAKGIHTSAMDTFNKAIDRNIDAQIQGIKTKGEVAEGFKSLWYMQRNQSASDAEARARVRGFLLEGAKQQVIANMAQYESALASAQGQAAIAKIDEELGKSLIEVYRHADANALALRNQALDKWRTQVNASLEQQSQALRRQEIGLKAKELAIKTAPEALIPIYSPESGKAEWAFNPLLKLSDTERAAVRDQFSATETVKKDLAELETLAKSGKVFDLIKGTRLAGTDSQRYDALALRVAHGMIKAFGEKATDQDVADMIKSFRHPTSFNAADTAVLIASTKQQMLRHTDSLVGTYAVDIPKEAQGMFGQSARTSTFDASQTEARNTINPPPLSMEERIRQEAAKYLAPAGAKDSIAKDEEILTEGIKEAKAGFVQANPEFAPKVPEAPKPDYYRDQVLGAKPPTPTAEVDITRTDKGLMMLARAAAGGDGVALKQLQQYAGEYVNAGKRDEVSMFAAYLLNEIQPGLGDNKTAKDY